MLNSMVAKWWQKWYPFTGLLLVAYMRWLGPGEEVSVGGNRSSGVSLPVPRCLTIETLWFRRDILVPTIKFSQGRQQDMIESWLS